MVDLYINWGVSCTAIVGSFYLLLWEIVCRLKEFSICYRGIKELEEGLFHKLSSLLGYLPTSGGMKCGYSLSR